MKSSLRTISRAIHLVFRRRVYWVIGASGAILVAAISLLVPSWLIPSNTLSFELSLMRPVNYATLALLSVASGTLISLNTYSFRVQRETLRAAGEGSIGAVVAVIGGLVSTSCGCGIGLLVGILGLGAGTATFIVAHQLWIQIGALAIVLIGLYYASRSIVGGGMRIISTNHTLS